jgi:hypothetical protein
MNASAGRRLPTDQHQYWMSVRFTKVLEYRLHEIYSDCASERPVRPGICDIALVIRQASLDIVIHTPPRPEYSIFPPASLVVKVVGVIFHCLHPGYVGSPTPFPPVSSADLYNYEAT